MLLSFSIEDFRLLVLGVGLWITVFYWAMLRQSFTRRRLKKAFISKLKKENGGQPVDLRKFGDVGSMSFMRNEPSIVNDPEFIRADRTFANLVEQGVPFFVSLALFSLLYSPVAAGYLAIIYAVSRSLYYPFYNNSLLLITTVTAPNYLIILGMFITVLFKVVF